MNTYQNIADKKRKEKSQRKLRDKCQQAKHQLTEADRVEISIEDFFKNTDFVQTVNRQQFEDLNRDLFEAALRYVQEALDGAHLLNDDVNDIVLVGGSTNIPKIQEMIRDLFKKSNIIKTVSVDEVVAIGAALEAARITKITPENLRVTEVTPFSLGTDVASLTNTTASY